MKKSMVRNGSVTLFSQHTTGAIRVSEDEKSLLLDYKDFFEKLAPKKGAYGHNETNVDGRKNAHSHLQSMLLNSAEGNTMFCRIDRGNCSIEPVSDRKWSAVIPREDRAYARLGNGHLAVYFGSRFGSMQVSTDTSLNRFAMVALVKHRTAVSQNTDRSVLDCIKGCVRYD